MAEIHVECPNCNSNIIMKLQSEVHVGEPRRRPPFRHAVLQQLSEYGAKVTLRARSVGRRHSCPDDYIEKRAFSW